MNNKQSGYYWVKLTANSEWELANYVDGYYWLDGDTPYSALDLAEVGGVRVVPPDECLDDMSDVHVMD